MPRELSNPLTEDDKAWLRSWNRGDEIPDEETEQQDDTPTSPEGSGGTTGGEGEDPFNGEEPPEDYNDWDTKQLQWELGNRNLPKSGKKSELVARLEEDDENSEDEPE